MKKLFLLMAAYAIIAITPATCGLNERPAQAARPTQGAICSDTNKCAPGLYCFKCDLKEPTGVCL